MFTSRNISQVIKLFSELVTAVLLLYIRNSDIYIYIYTHTHTHTHTYNEANSLRLYLMAVPSLYPTIVLTDDLHTHKHTLSLSLCLQTVTETEA